MVRPGIICRGCEGLFVIRLRPCMARATPPRPHPTPPLTRFPFSRSSYLCDKNRVGRKKTGTVRDRARPGARRLGVPPAVRASERHPGENGPPGGRRVCGRTGCSGTKIDEQRSGGAALGKEGGGSFGGGVRALRPENNFCIQKKKTVRFAVADPLLRSAWPGIRVCLVGPAGG